MTVVVEKHDHDGRAAFDPEQFKQRGYWRFFRKVQFGREALVRFSIVNVGGHELFLDNVSSSCSCAGLEREVNGHLARIESLRIPAGEQRELMIRSNVRGSVGASMVNFIHFHTNDPSLPTVAIEL